MTDTAIYEYLRKININESDLFALEEDDMKKIIAFSDSRVDQDPDEQSLKLRAYRKLHPRKRNSRPRG